MGVGCKTPVMSEMTGQVARVVTQTAGSRDTEKTVGMITIGGVMVEGILRGMTQGVDMTTEVAPLPLTPLTTTSKIQSSRARWFNLFYYNI